VGRDNPLSITPPGDDPITVKRAVPLGNWPQPYNQIRVAQPNPQVSIIQPPSVRRTSGFNALVVTCLIVIPGGIILASIASHGDKSVAGTRPSPTPTPVAFLNEVRKHDANVLGADTLIESYGEVLRDAFPLHNGIKVKIRKVKGGVGLFGFHDFFNQYEFSYGSSGPTVGRWIIAHKQELDASHVIRVGVYGEGPYSSGVWYPVK
jgi:hypothetical protein